MNRPPVNIALLGVGNMGRNHLRNLDMLKRVNLSFVYDINRSFCEEVAALYDLKCSDDLERDLQGIDGVIIATPTSTHYDYIERVAPYVKNIFVEKPLTEDVESARKICKLAKEKELNIQVGFIERYNPAVEALKKVIQNTDHVVNIDFTRTNKVSSRITDVDVVIDLMIHDIDLAMNINGNVEEISAHGYIKNGMIEYARAIITHENGSFSNIVASRITEKRMRHISATCEDMYIDCNLLNKEVIVNRQTLEQYLDDVSISSREETITVGLQEALLSELMDFQKLCWGDPVDVANEIDGTVALEVAGRIQKIIMEQNR